jgi:hypothetical protein
MASWFETPGFAVLVTVRLELIPDGFAVIAGRFGALSQRT